LSRTYDINLNDYEDVLNIKGSDRQERRKRKLKANKHTPKKTQQQVVAELAETSAVEGAGFKTIYQASRHEEGWLMQSLYEFYRQDYITDVLAQVKGGKEASVYRCAARPGQGVELLAAKVYRPQKFRQLRNDKMYREGRAILTAEGRAVKETDHRTMRALGKKSAYGEQVSHTSWLMFEYTTLQQLYNVGAAVPKPYAASENAILMEYIGGAEMAAPPLSVVELERDEAIELYGEVVRNIELMLQYGMIHGDLSAYNILYWEGKITLIDFPQVTNSHSNSEAYFILERDIERICDYFASQGVRTNPQTLMRHMWKKYVEQDAQERAADLSRMLEPEEE
jgi:RIO kinase 1